MAPQRALHNRIWEHKSSTILFSSVQNNSTDRVRCHPWSALIFWNAKIKQYAWPPSTFPMNPTPLFSIIYQKIITFHPAELFFSFSFFFAKIAWNAIVCATTDVSRKTATFSHIPENVIPGDFSQKKNEKKKKRKRKKRKITEYEDFMECEKISCRVRGFYSMCASLAVECDVPCGVRRICGMRRIPSMRGWYRVTT